MVGRHARFAVIVLVLGLSSAVQAQQALLPPIAKGTVHVGLQPLLTGLVSPTDLMSAGNDPNRLFVTDQNGQVRIIDHGTPLPQPFLDISSRVVTLSPGYIDTPVRQMSGIAR